MQQGALTSIRRTIANWGAKNGTIADAQEFIESDPIVRFALNVIMRIDTDYDSTKDFIDAMESNLVCCYFVTFKP